MIRCALVVPALMAIAPVAAATTWGLVASLPGGFVGCFAFDAKTPGVVLAGSTGGVILRSTDGGAHWTQMRVAPANQEFRAIAQSPAATGTFYAFGSGYAATGNVIGSGLVYVSTDDGVSWKALPHQPPVVATYYRGSGRGIAIDATGRIIVLVDHYGGIYRSTNAGESWSVIEPGNTIAPYSLAQYPKSPNTLVSVGFERTSTAKVPIFLKSIDFGATWAITTPPQLNAGGSFPVALGIAVQPITGTIFATYEGNDPATGAVLGGVARSTDGGNTWAASNTGLLAGFIPGNSTGSIAFDPANPAVLYLSTNGLSQLGDGTGLYISRDSGAHWVASGKALPQKGAFTVAARPAMAGYPAAVFAGGDDIAITTDRGVQWTANIDGFANGAIAGAADSGAAGGLYARGYTGVFRSANNGLSWTPAAALPGSHFVQSLAVDLTRATHPVYAATLTRLFRSVDGGASWVSIQPHLGDGLGILGVYVDSSSNLFAADSGHTLYRSVNEGVSWTAVPIGAASDQFAYQTPLVMANAPAGSAAHGLMYANLSNKLWTSANFGATWAPVSAPLPAADTGIANTAEPGVSPYTLLANTYGNGDAVSLLPGASSFTILPAATNSGFSYPPAMATAPASNFAVNAYQTSAVLGSTNSFTTSADEAATLAGLDSQNGAAVFLTKTRLFVGDYDGSTFALPY